MQVSFCFAYTQEIKRSLEHKKERRKNRPTSYLLLYQTLREKLLGFSIALVRMGLAEEDNL